MSILGKPVRIALLAATLVAVSPGAVAPMAIAQELSASHVAIALTVVKSAGATRGFDNVLPILANKVTDRLISIRPDLHKEIAAAVEAVVVKLAVRRAELDNDVARIWAKYFTEEELQTLAQFYQSPAGKKFSEIGPQMVAESYQVVDRWSNRVGDELLEKTREELKSRGFEIGN
ncbi:MAG: DUF2059 domain-containing protein [Bauldia sp.]|nr:DUF2059 domain-containing protein [Bauldia sp.]